MVTKLCLHSRSHIWVAHRWTLWDVSLHDLVRVSCRKELCPCPSLLPPTPRRLSWMWSNHLAVYWVKWSSMWEIWQLDSPLWRSFQCWFSRQTCHQILPCWREDFERISVFRNQHFGYPQQKWCSILERCENVEEGFSVINTTRMISPVTRTDQH